MYKTDPLLIEKCRILRERGFTLGKIIKATKLPKTTVYEYIQDIPLSLEVKEKLVKENIQRLREIARKRRRIVPKPKGWTNELIFLTAHFMFDGEVRYDRCVYQNRNIALVSLVEQFMQEVFNLKPYHNFYQETGVHRISYYYVELTNYFREKVKKLKKYIKTAFLSEKRMFLQTFFDDEGCVYRWRNARKVRGYQHDLEMLKLIQKLLEDFDIESRIDEKYKEIVISGKENLIKFRDKINFSKGIYINPERKNSIWKRKLEKREILNKIINSYQD